MSDLIERDGHLKENWYIACTSQELGKKPLQRRIYDTKLVLFRNTKGEPTALVDRCLHRAATLSEGQVQNGNLVCPYHSWTYNREGEVVSIPSEGPGLPKRKHCARSFPTVEKNGVIWVWMGEKGKEQENQIWTFPNQKEKGWTSYFMITDFDNEVTNLVENFIDVPHTVSVHKGWFRNESLKKVPILTETKEGKVLVTYNQPQDNIGVLIRPLLNPKNEPMEHTDCFVYPNITRVDYKFGSNYQYIINSQCTPVSTLKTRVYTYIAYKLPLLGRPLKPFIRYYTRKVIEQDVWIMDVQKQNLNPGQPNRFSSTPADEPHMQIERLRRLGANGDEKLWDLEKSVEGEIWI